MKRIKNADINFKLNPKRINLNNFSMKFYTVNSEAYFFIKDQDNVVSVEREATIYDDPEVIISGGTVAVDYYLPLDWSELVQLGEGVLNYRCINNIEDPFFPDLVYNQVVEDTTAYYIDSDIHIDPADDKNLIERVVELESNLAVETADREDADVFLSGAVDTEIARAISAETTLQEEIDELASGTSEALDAEIARAEAAEAALQDAIDAEEARAIAIENAIRQDLTDESELRSSADTTMWTAINNETTRATSAETAIENKVDVETLRAIGVENAISGDLQTYKATNNAALQAETTRATSAETALQTAIQNEATARANADTALGTRIDNISSASTAAIEAEAARAQEAESGLTTALQNEVTRATSAETQLSNSLTTEINRATSAETAIDNKIDAETLRAIGVENTISGNLETYKATANAALQAETTRATSAETALQTAIDNEATARANADTALQTAITNEVSRAREAESGITNSLNAEVTRATGAENALDDKIDAETTRATGAEAALDVKIGTVSGNVISETSRATTTENALSGAIDSISAATSGSVEELDAKIDTVSGNVITEEARAKGVENALSGAIDTIDAKFIDDAKYEMSGQTHVINFYNGNVVKATIDCTDFLVDGMIDNVYIENGYLVIDFNTASGKQDIRIPLTDIFNPANYYTKSETSGATEIANALALKLNIADFNTYSAATDTVINSKAAQTIVDALSGTVTAHTADTTIHVTSSDKEKWNKVDDKADTTALTAVNDALTAHTADSVAHITAAERTAWNAKADESAFTAHTADTTIHLTSGDVQSQISGKANSDDVYLKTETSGATEIATALSAKLDATAYTPTDLSNYYQKSETSGATEIATALAAKADPYSAGSNITIVDNVISAEGGGKAVTGGTNISVVTGETADTINCTLPIFVHSNSGRGDIRIGTDINANSDYYRLGIGRKIDMSSSYGSGSIAIGVATSSSSETNKCYGESNVAIGRKFQIGESNSRSGINIGCVVIGNNAKSLINNGVAIGSNTTVSGTTKTNINNQLTIDTSNQVYIYNKDNTEMICLQDQLGGGGSSYSAGTGIDITNDVISVTGKVDTLTYNTYTAATDAALASKQTTLTAGTGIDITSNVISVTGGTGGGITSGECQTLIDQSISGKTNQSDFTAHTANTSIHVTTAQTAAWDAKSDFSGSYNDLTDKPTIPTVPTSNTAFTNDAGYITANDITGKTDVTAFTAHTGDTTIHVTSSDKTSWNGAATNASNAITALGGLSLVKLTQAQYNALATKDNNTLYVIVG